MGVYLNSSKAKVLYESVLNTPYFVDKSELLKDLIPLVESGNQYICITRPRRFGKTVMANMIGSFFGKGDSKNVFENLGIAKTCNIEKHINQHNVIHIDFSKLEDECENYNTYISNIKDILRDDLREAFPDVRYREKGNVIEDLLRITEKTGEKFIFVLDEWDAVFHMKFVSENDCEKYLLFLKNILKDQPYVELAYMTGILPIAKYSSGSELNMFAEYTMNAQHMFGDYFGFTETEVNSLYEKYLDRENVIRVSREGLRIWYNGYHTLSGERLYNPRSVVLALTNNQLADYWTSSGPYDEIYYYVKNNISDVRDDIALMLAGETVSANIKEYAATSTEIKTRDQILSAMVVYGFLTADEGKVSIPNKELMDKFVDMVCKENELGYVYRLAKESERMLKATLSGDTETMELILKQAHDTETGMLGYNSEVELSSVIILVYLAARDKYDIQREDKSGVGYVDYIFYPINNFSDDCIILELKVDCTAEEAVNQIKERNYVQRFIGKLGEKPRYTGRILAVGISYYKNDMSKKHECKVEILKAI